MDNPFIDAMIAVESSGDPQAQSPVGARGLMQIMPSTLKEYNQYNKTDYSDDDLFDPVINRTVGSWYVNKRIPQMLSYYGKPITPQTILWAYNAGIGNLIKNIQPEETKNYIPKVLERLKK